MALFAVAIAYVVASRLGVGVLSPAAILAVTPAGLGLGLLAGLITGAAPPELGDARRRGDTGYATHHKHALYLAVCDGIGGSSAPSGRPRRAAPTRSCWRARTLRDRGVPAAEDNLAMTTDPARPRWAAVSVAAALDAAVLACLDADEQDMRVRPPQHDGGWIFPGPGTPRLRSIPTHRQPGDAGWTG